ncbi:ankyrin repeat domain-containing protein [uncultured Pseudoteredinibacter sp.]|uniref:ankyrin repeat domain-containing protein n=1 Tax=uncultured Pseudoteredinibacter sp. TaxID=1641701 RepID=UPI002637C247|nr:ankyrin repeat domain-containing protein [uncultured Pseudoteredinibacter sp.]
MTSKDPMVCLIALISIVMTTVGIGAAENEELGLGGKAASNIPFPPILVVNKDEKCDLLLEDAKQKFLTTTDLGTLYGSRGYGLPKSGAVLTWDTLGNHELKSVKAYGAKYYLDYVGHPGCGGGCEAHQPVVAKRPFPEPRDYQYLGTLSKFSPPALAYSYLIARESNESPPYLFYWGDRSHHVDDVFIYRLSVEGRWSLACKIVFSPNEKQSVHLPPVLKQLDDLKSTLGGLRRDSGLCGSLRSHSRLQYKTVDELNRTLYRPWALTGAAASFGNSFGDYEKTLKSFEKWSLTGISEYAAYNLYRSQLQVTTKALANFYQATYKWSQDKSERIAGHALKGAISRGFVFGTFDPGFAIGEAELRKLILEKSTVERITKIKLNFQELDNKVEYYSGSNAALDSVLNVAILHPKALENLLNEGLDPNVKNAFGKTPLMYAAQHNALESARILLKYGARTVDLTTRPEDSCYYKLSTYNVSALHYAVRYASVEFIELLLDHGAPTFIRTKNSNGITQERGTPLDWFYRYSKGSNLDNVSGLKKELLPGLEKRLAPPSQSMLKRMFAEYVQKAVAHHKQGRYEDSYRGLMRAIEIEPASEVVLNEISLVARKVGALKISLSSSNRLVGDSQNEDFLANAWFNMGLACQKLGKESGHGWVYFDRKYYCEKVSLEYFLSSYSYRPLKKEKRTIVNFFSGASSDACKIKVGSADVDYPFQLFNVGSNIYLYVLHPSTVMLNAEVLHSPKSDGVGMRKQASKNFKLSFVEKFVVDDYLISKFHVSDYYRSILYTKDHVCEAR